LNSNARNRIIPIEKRAVPAARIGEEILCHHLRDLRTAAGNCPVIDLNVIFQAAVDVFCSFFEFKETSCGSSVQDMQIPHTNYPSGSAYGLWTVRVCFAMDSIETQIERAIPQNTYFTSVEIRRGDLCISFQRMPGWEGKVRETGGSGHKSSLKSVIKTHFEPRVGPVQPCFLRQVSP